jgi:hypothetical protein
MALPLRKIKVQKAGYWESLVKIFSAILLKILARPDGSGEKA